MTRAVCERGAKLRRSARRGVALAVLLGAAVAGSALTTACGPPLRAAVSMSVHRQRGTPADASVTIDEEYIGPLSYVAAHGVRLPVGEHRITVERDGYFPFDVLVVADRQPVKVVVKLVRVPD